MRNETGCMLSSYVHMLQNYSTSETRAAASYCRKGGSDLCLRLVCRIVHSYSRHSGLSSGNSPCRHPFLAPLVWARSPEPRAEGWEFVPQVHLALAREPM